MGKVEFSHTKIVCLIIIGLIAVGSGQAIGFGTSSLLGTSQTTNVIADTPNISQLDVSDNVVNYSRINTWGGGSYEEQIDMCIVGDFAYVARQDLLIYDISNVSTPYLLGRFECQWGSIVKVFVQDNIACLVCNAIGIVMVNVTDPLNPVELGKCGYFDGQDREYDDYKAEFISSGYRTGDLVFLVAEGGRFGIVNYKTTHYLYAFDVSDPLYPVPVGSYTKNNVEDSITVIGDYCYLFLQGSEVQLPLSIFLLKEPAKLRHVDDVENLVEHNTEFVVSGDLALARKNDSVLAILDVTNPVVPVNLSYIPGDVFSIYALSESTAYILNRKTKVLEIYDLADPSNPISKGQTILDGVLKKIINRDNYLYIIGSHLQIVDVANLSAPTLLSKIAGTDGPDYCLAVANRGSSTYILDNKNGISIVNFANYTHPELISQYYSKNLEEKGLWYESDMHVSGNYIYLYSRNFLEIIDVIDEENPFLEAEMIFTENVQEVFVKNKILFVLDDVELKLYDISNSTIPTYLSSIESDSGTQIFADKQIVYHTKYHDSNERTNLTIYNLTDTTVPIILSSHIIEHRVFDMTIRNDYLYILSDEFIIIDAKNATDLITIGSLVLEESMHYDNLLITTDKAYFSNYAKLVIVDIFNQSEPLKYSEYASQEYITYNSADHYAEYPIHYEITGISLENDIVILGFSSLGLELVSADDDSDLLPNEVEIDIYNTNTVIADSDADGFSDFYEVMNGLDPLDPADALLDSDQDGLDNQLEFSLGTHPMMIDTDTDGLSDYIEINMTTNPLYFDTDGEGLSDGIEVNILFTDPLLVDTDEDKIDDFTELTRGLDPTFWSNWTKLFGGYLVPVYVVMVAVPATILGIKAKKKRSRESSSSE